MGLIAVTILASGAIGKERPHEHADTSALDSVLSSPTVTWHVGDLHPSLRSRVHLTSKQTPVFPYEDPKLMDPRRWTPMMFIKGQPCSLLIQTGESDMFWSVRSLDEVKPGAGHCMSYRGNSRDWKTRLGPSYCWTGKGALFERSWKDGDTLRYEIYTYQYYPSGELHRFEYRKDGYDLRTTSRSMFEWLDERFARDGTLIGCGNGAGPTGSENTWTNTHTYWLGKPVGYREFRERAREALIRAMRAPTAADSTR